MLKKFLILASFVLFIYSLFSCVRAADIIELWSYTYNISYRDDKPEDVAIDSQDHIIVVGSDRTETGYQWRIMKFDEDKNLLWNKSYDLNNNKPERAYSVAVDSQDNIIVVGHDSNTTNADNQWRIMKFSPSGISMKNRTINISSDSDIAYGVAVDSQDNIIVVGHDSNTTNADNQWRIMKFNSTLDHIWNYTANPSPAAADNAYAVAIDSQDNIIAAGRDRNFTLGGYQFRIMKFNSTGHSLWNYTKDLSTSTDQLEDVAIDSQDNIIVVGWDREPGNYQWRIMKFNSTLDYIWNYTFNASSSTDRANGVAIDSQDNIIVVGWDRVESTFGDDQWRILKLTPSGSYMWNHTVNISDSYDVATAVATDPHDNIMVVGYDTPDPTRSGDYEWRIMKFTFCGNGEVDDLEVCDYSTINPHSPCLSYQYCDNFCRCRDLFNVWLEPNQMLFTIAQKTPINLYIKNTGEDTDTYSIEAEPSNPAVIDVDISGSSPTGPVDKGTTELVRPWVTVLAATTSGKITFNITSLGYPGKYRITTLSISEGLPISLPEFNILGLITIMVLAGIVYFYALKKPSNP